MKHLLNDLSEEEKNRIREQHTGGKKIMIENFNKLINTKLGDARPITERKVVKRVIKENQNELDNIINDLEELKNSEHFASPKRNVTKLSMMKKYEDFEEKLTMSKLSKKEKDEYKNKFGKLFKDIFIKL